MNPHTKTKQQTVSSFDRYCDKKSDFKSCPKATSFFRSMFEKFNYSEDNFDYVFDYFKNPDNLTKFNELIEPVKIQVSSIRSIILLQNINHDKLVTLQVVLQQLLLNVEKLETLKTLGIKFSNISCILSGTGNNAPKALGELLKAIDANKKILEKLKIPFSSISGILGGARKDAPKAFEELLKAIDANKKILEKLKIPFSNISGILHKIGKNAPKAFEELLKAIDANKKILEKLKIPFSNIASILHGAGKNAPKAFEELLKAIDANKKILEKLKIPFSNISGILAGAINNAPKAFEELLKAIDANKKILEKLKIPFSNISGILHKIGKNTPKVFEELLKAIDANKKILEKLKIPFSNISGILNGAGNNAPKAFEELLKAIDANKKILETSGIKFSNISNILHGAGKNAPKAFEELLKAIDANKEILETSGIKFSNIASILNGAGNNAPKAFEELLKAIDANKEILETSGIKFSNIASILNGAGKNAPKAFEELLKAIDANKEILRTLHPDVLDKLRSEGKYIPKALEKLLKQNPCILKDDYDTAIEESTSSQTNIIYVIYAAPDTDVVNNQPCFTEANEGYHNDSIQELQVAQVSHENAIQYEEQLDQQDYNYDNLTTSSEIVSNEYYNQIAMVNNVAESANHNIPIISNDLQTTIIFRDHKEISNDPDISQLLDDIYKDSGVKRKLDQSEDFHVQKHHCNYDNLSSNTLEDPETIGVNNKDDYDTAIEESTSSQTNIIYAALDTNVVNNQPCFTEANEGYHDDSIQELQVAQVSHENAIQHEYYNQIAMVNNVAESANHNIPIINNDLQQTTIIFRDHKEIFDDPNISQLLDDIHKGSGVKRKLDQSEDFYGQKHHCNYDNLSSNTLEDPEIIGVNNMYD